MSHCGLHATLASVPVRLPHLGLGNAVPDMSPILKPDRKHIEERVPLQA